MCNEWQAHPDFFAAVASMDCCTCCTNFWPLAPFLFLRPKVLSSTACKGPSADDLMRLNIAVLRSTARGNDRRSKHSGRLEHCFDETSHRD